MFGHDHKDEQSKANGGGDVVQPMTSQPVTSGLLGIDDDEPTSAVSGAPTTPSVPADPIDDEPSLPTSDITPSSTAPSATVGGDDNLLDIKREALQELSPLVDQLEQTPEEKFKITMMMIQASDNKSLVSSAFRAAKDIKDNKKRAQALLDIVNEINYFTQQTKS